MTARHIIACLLAGALMLAGGGALRAQETDGQQQADALQAAVDALQNVTRPGPAYVKLNDTATLNLPEGAGFVRQPEGGNWASVADKEKYADFVNADLVGTIIPMSEQNWVTFINYHAGTHIKDEGAADWDPAALLKVLKADNDAGNATRKQREEPETEIGDWLQAPSYDGAAHKLIWAVTTTEKGGESDSGTSRIHGYAVGRDGYFELTMMSPTSEVASHVAMARALLAGLQIRGDQAYSSAVPGGGIKERDITGLIATIPAGAMDRLLAGGGNWLWLAIGGLVLVILAGGIGVVLRRRAAA